MTNTRLPLLVLTLLGSTTLLGCPPSTSGTDASSDVPHTTDVTSGSDGGVDASGDSATPTDATSTDVTTGTDSGSMSDVTSTTDSGGACNSLVPTAPAIAPTCPTGDAPAAAGGTVVPGTYNLTARNVYGAPAALCGGFAGMSVSGIAMVTATTINLNESAPDGGEAAGPETFTYTTSGTMLTETPTCPAGTGSPMTLTYTATATTFKLYGTVGGTLVAEEIYTLR